MRTHALLPALALVALTLLAAPARALAGTEVKQTAKGMTYSLRVPAGYSAAEGALLVVCLHGQGGSHTQFLRQVEPAPFLGRAILLAPNATAGAAWEESDIDLIADAVKEVRARYRTYRTLALGFSRGAYMGFGLGLRRPDIVEGVIAHSGGLVVPVPDTQGAKEQVFAVIHGDADGTVPVSASREAVKTLEAAGLKSVKYEELKGLGHTVDARATERALDWIESTLDARAAERIAAVERAVKEKDPATIAGALDGIGGVGKALAPKATALATKQLASPDDAVAKAAAGALGRIGGDPAIGALMKALPPLEAKKAREEVAAAINEALQTITGESRTGSKEWKKWAAGRKA